MAKGKYEPTTRPMSVEDVQEAISEALALIAELESLIQKSAANPAKPRGPIDPLTERRIERLKDRLRECNRAVANLPKQTEGFESIAKRLAPLAEAAIRLFAKLFGGGASP